MPIMAENRTKINTLEQYTITKFNTEQENAQIDRFIGGIATGQHKKRKHRKRNDSTGHDREIYSDYVTCKAVNHKMERRILQWQKQRQ